VILTELIKRKKVKLQKIILASSSPSRLALLKQINVVPDIICPADIDEARLKKEKPDAMAMRLARLKAEKVSAEYPEDLVIGADTVSVVSNTMLRKTYEREQARKNLIEISGRRHRLYTSLCVIVKDRNIKIERTILSKLKFKKFSEAELEEYLDSEQWKGCSGSYAIEGLAAKYVTWISGSFSNILGLPVAELHKILSGIDINIKGYNGQKH